MLTLSKARILDYKTVYNRARMASENKLCAREGQHIGIADNRHIRPACNRNRLVAIIDVIHRETITVLAQDSFAAAACHN